MGCGLSGAPAGPAPAALDARAVSKRFAGGTVLHPLDVRIEPGQVLGLLGHNGSGKSTFVKILAGYHRAEPGASITVGGRPLASARRLIGFVHQDLGLLGSASVLENFGLGRYQTARCGSISWRRERDRLYVALDRFGLRLPPDRPVAELPAADRAILAIARGFDHIAGRPRALLVLDEPTAFLDRDGVARVLAAIRVLAGHGASALLVTHNLAEVALATDRVVALRDGHRVLDAVTASVSRTELIEAIAPESTVRPEGTARPRATDPRRRASGSVLLRAVGLASRTVERHDVPVHGVSFELRAGQILGLTGLPGSGFQQVPHLLFGAKPGQGRLELPDRALELTGLNPARAIGAGLALLPRDRAGQAAVLEASAAENITLGNLGQDLVRGRLRYSRSLERAAAAMRDCGVRPVAPRRALRTFSGGNQQKAVLAKWLDRDPAVLLLDEPALGIDLASRTQLFARIRALADGGAAVLVASLDHNDLAALCDTVLVMRGGRIGARLSGGELTPATILARCYPPRSAR